MDETISSTTSTAPVTTIASLGQHEGETITLRGWLYNLRESGKLLFPIFRDGTGTVQGIVPKSAVPSEVFERIKGLTQESSVIVRGKVRADKRAPSGVELDVEDLEVVDRVPEDAPFPISLKEHGVDFLMEHRHLWIRTPRQAAILRTRAEIMRAAQEYFDTAWICPHRSADPDTGGLRRHQHIISCRLFWRRSLPDAERPVVHREHGDGTGQGLLLWADVSRGEIEDAAPPDGVLDD